MQRLGIATVVPIGKRMNSEVNIGGIAGVVLGALLAGVIGYALYDPSDPTKRAAFSIPVAVFIACAVGCNTIGARFLTKK